MSFRPAPADRSIEELLSFGVVNLDKPPGPSAHQVTGWARDAIADGCTELGVEPIEAAAHAGTLDPKVTGCLPILLADATRMAQVFLEGSKEYVAVLELHGPAPATIEQTIAEFEAPLYQKPPRKSAVSRRLRVREIYDLAVLDIRDRQVLLRVRCESGTYIRKLCHDLGLALGTGGHMGHLRRTATDPFDDTDLVSMYELVDALAFAADGDEEPLRSIVSPAERALSGLPSVTIAPSAAEQVAHGAPVYAPGVISVEGDPSQRQLVACYLPNGTAICLGRFVGDPDAASGTVVNLERVLV
ncbi:RNA-guided pseudouridylation complex pseudouridine synthase subunit Cbf5 [Natronocalculus amylovorans]|uniref:Probable tRNA pseudouridine synthase B n=1 Tax=Natronocalculus amylovorans TaxID=2917812 RepID=A0AAE3K7M1_9EURY|nr:RNA-guided pseudouridylation complex pseudouridine synthase subunit Cbf5 [Natronocalculus amylovorans]MCL9816372.1 RNA-guided pseudouridylation complex pseudouridine synthase subunit Cbf5 [Natronocalculus amylovorans]